MNAHAKAKRHVWRLNLQTIKTIGYFFVVLILVAAGLFAWYRYSTWPPVRAGVGENMLGWAWSNNTGWMSFNSSNCDLDNDGVMDRTNVGAGSGDAGAPTGCPADGAAVLNYGVAANPLNGKLSGWAWSQNIGWITFDRAVAGTPPAAPYNGAEDYVAFLDNSTNKVTGWGRAVIACRDSVWDAILNRCTSSSGGELGGGWDGWIKLGEGSNYGVSRPSCDLTGWAWGGETVGWLSFNSANQIGPTPYKVSMKNFCGGNIYRVLRPGTPPGCELTGWAWGGDVIGWISFSSANVYSGETPGATYGATMKNFCANVNPNPPTNLSVSNTAGGTLNCVSPLQPTFSWTFSDNNTDDMQKYYQVQVDDDAAFGTPEDVTNGGWDSGQVLTTPSLPHAKSATPPLGKLKFNTAYYWRVKTWDDRKTSRFSDFATAGSSFTTTRHAWPAPDFSIFPARPSLGETTTFNANQDSTGPFNSDVDTLPTQCFDNSNNVITCTKAGGTLGMDWAFTDGAPSSATASSSPQAVFSGSTGDKPVTLTATHEHNDGQGNHNFVCAKTRTISYKLKLPDWKEVLPR